MKNIKQHLLRICVTISFLIVTSVSFCQNSNQLDMSGLLPQFSRMTPEAESLGRYGNFDVSEYSGALDIKIPLCTIKSGDVTCPIELYYDATGIKVDQDATIVGLGWNLNFGGCINHIVCGLDDFGGEPDSRGREIYKKYWSDKLVSDEYPLQSFHQYGTPLEMNPNVPYNNHPKYYYLNDPLFILNTDMADGHYIPDIFTAYFFGHHLSFCIDRCDNNKIVILNDNSKKYNITFNYDPYPGSYPKYFIITDDRGINYKFCAFREFDHEDSYYLTNIYGADGINGKSAVSIEYKQIFYNVAESRANIKQINTITERISEYCSSDLQLEFDAESVHAKFSNSEMGDSRKVYPSKIKTALDAIEFNYLDREDILGSKAISSMIVKSEGGNPIKKISFSYDYYNEKSSAKYTTKKRLRLCGVNINEKEYKFSYNSDELPEFGASSKDYWGYYNGVNNGTLCGTPKYTIENGNVKEVKSLGDANRYASEDFCKIGMLKKITYPTGGYSVYDFESNRFNDKYYYYPDANKKVGPFIVTKSVYDDGISVYGTGGGPKSISKTFTIKQTREYKLRASATTTKGSCDISSVTIKTSSGSIIRHITASVSSNLETIEENITLNKGEYIMEANIDVGGKGYETTATCSIYHEDTTKMEVKPVSANECGGYSFGGGLRIKSIKNYDAPSNGNKFLGGAVYEYSDGKLLVPTSRLYTRIVNFKFRAKQSGKWSCGDFWFWVFDLESFNSGPPKYIKADYYVGCSEPNYMYMCSMESPATVGYSEVIKKSVNEKNEIIGVKKYLFHNNGYIIDETTANISDNVFFNIPDGHLNGKLYRELFYSGNGILKKSYSYQYISEKMGTLFCPKSVRLYRLGLDLRNYVHYNIMFAKRFYWSYLSESSESEYDDKGKLMETTTTTYDYLPSNYQVSKKTVSRGTENVCVKYWYPVDKKTEGTSFLSDNHYLSEVTATDSYHNGEFIGGNKFNYTSKNGLPVVKSAYSVHPKNNTELLEMLVNNYDNAGNIREYQRKDGTIVTIIWSYNHQYPIMEIVGCTYKQVENCVSEICKIENSISVSESVIVSMHYTLRTNFPHAHVTAYIYNPMYKIAGIIEPNGKRTNYRYDEFGRLAEVLYDSNMHKPSDLSTSDTKKIVSTSLGTITASTVSGVPNNNNSKSFNVYSNSVLSIKGSIGSTSNFSYGSQDLLITVINSKTNQTVLNYYLPMEYMSKTCGFNLSKELSLQPGEYVIKANKPSKSNWNCDWSLTLLTETIESNSKRNEQTVKKYNYNFGGFGNK